MASISVASLSLFLTMLPLSHAAAQAQTEPSSTRKEDGIYCRPPQPRTDSRLPAPRVCMPIQRWNALHASGYDVDADGKVKPAQGLNDLNNLSH